MNLKKQAAVIAISLTSALAGELSLQHAMHYESGLESARACINPKPVDEASCIGVATDPGTMKMDTIKRDILISTGIIEVLVAGVGLGLSLEKILHSRQQDSLLEPKPEPEEV